MLRAAMRLSLQLQYAICGIFDLAYNGHGELVPIQVISERQAIPPRYLEQIFQRLRRADLVTSKRGPGGGYALAREPEEISLRAVVEAVEGPLTEVVRAQPEATPFRPDFLWTQLAHRLARTLEEVTLARLCEDAAGASVPRAEAESPMYFI